MARPIRIEHVGAWYHVTARGNEQRPIYRDARDRTYFCELLGETVGAFAWRLHAYVLMDNHFHLLVETTEPNLSRSMQRLNVSYSVWFNRRHQRCGHLFQGRYKAIIVDPLAWGLELSRYIHLNPVRIGRLGLGKTARQRDHAGATEKPNPAEIKARVRELRNYRWSSYRAYLGLDAGQQWLTREKIFDLGGGGSALKAREAYRQYNESAARQGMAESPWEQLRAQTVLGGIEFLRQLRQPKEANPREHSRARELSARPQISDIIEVVAEIKGEPWEKFRDRHDDWGRDLALYLGKKGLGISLRELGHAAGAMDYASVSVSVKRFAQRLKKDPDLRHALRRCQQRLPQMLNVEM